MTRPCVRAGFEVPLGFNTPDFKVRPLLIGDVVKDYDAVMTSVKDLKGIFGPHSSWPQDDMSLEQDLIDLGWHHKEFQRGTSFAYTVMAPDESICLGCVYIYPSDKQGYDAHAYCWVRSSHKHLDAKLYQAFRDWVAQAWEFKAVAYPGREPSWAAWEKLGPA